MPNYVYYYEASTGLVNKTSESTSSGSSETHGAPLAPTGTIAVRYALSNAAIQTAEERVQAPPYEIHLTKNAVAAPIVPGSVDFTLGGKRYIDRMGSLFTGIDPATGFGVVAGSINYQTGAVKIDGYQGGDKTLTVSSCSGRIGAQFLCDIAFRTPGAPVRPGQLVVACVDEFGNYLSATADEEGHIRTQHMHGEINYTTGVCTIGFGALVDFDPSMLSEPWYNPGSNFNGQDGKTWKPKRIYADSFTFACVLRTYIPLDSSLIGVNTVRLPMDGCVPIIRVGDVVVIHNADVLTLSTFPAHGAKVILPRPCDNVEIYDSTAPPQRLPKTLYSFAPGDNFLTIAGDANFAGYQLPLRVSHRIEERQLVSDTQINGQITVSRLTQQDYPVDGTLVSSAMIFGNLQARYENIFDQQTWQNSWAETPQGSIAGGTYNDIDYPVRVKNSGCITERWAIVFQDATTVRVIGEKRGQIVQNHPISQDLMPVNSATGQPFFFMDFRGFGAGWAANNVIRFNTIGAAPPFWIAETVLPGPASQLDFDQFVLFPRVEVE